MARVSSDQQVEEVRLRSDIVDVIGTYLPLKKAGANFKALCPFHNEKTPSFHVNAARQIFRCFGCGRGGDVFRFVMLYENVPFPDALRRLADRAGVALREAGPRERKSRETRTWMLELHADVAAWYAHNLWEEPDGAAARAYLESRAIPREWAGEWVVGCAPPRWDGLLSWATRAGWSIEQLAQAGLVMPSSEAAGRSYDRFRGRLMFPIADDQGRIVGFSGRLLDPDAKEAKYVNSPETPIFVKGRLLYGLQRARRAIIDAKRAIVCEGQIDVIRMQMCGFPNTVAPLGTAFTEAHAHILGRLADQVVLLFDADAAGRSAALRSFESLLSTSVEARVARLPGGHDPDSLLRGERPEVVGDLVDRARDMVDYLLDLLMEEHDVGSVTGRLRITEEAVGFLSRIEDPVLRDASVARVALRTGLRRDALEQRLETQRRPRRSRDAPEPEQRDPGPFDAERILLRLLLTREEIAGELAAELAEVELSDRPAGRLLATAQGLWRDNRWDGHGSLLAAARDDPDAQDLLAALLLDQPAGEDPRRAARDCLDTIELGRLRREKEAVKRRIAELNADPGAADEVRTEQHRLVEIVRRERALSPLERNVRAFPPLDRASRRS